MTGVEMAPGVPDPAWAAAELLERAEVCTSLSPAWLVPLAALDPEALTPDDRVTLTLVMQRMTAVTESIALRALGSVQSLSCVPDPKLRAAHPEAAERMCPGGVRCDHRWELDELSALTGLPRHVVGRRRGLAWQLVDAWPELVPLLAGGRITVEHLNRFHLATLNANEVAMAAAVEAFLDLLERQPHVSVERVSRVARRVVARYTEPAEAKATADRALREETGVEFQPLSDGLAAITLTGPTHQLEAIRALVRDHPAVTRPDPDDTRTRGQREVDLLVGLCLMGSGYGANTGLISPWSDNASTPAAAAGAGFTADDHCAGSQGPADADTGWPADDDGWSGPDTQPGARTSRAGWVGTSEAAEPAVGVMITASLETLLGISNEPGLVGDSIISAAIIRQWAADPVWARQAIIDADGHVTSVGGKQRFPTGRLKRAVQMRWQRCTFPGCNRRAADSQVDHAHDHALGGDTTLANLHPLCLKHHRMKDLPGVRVRLTDEGTAVWTMPSGRTVHVPAWDYTAEPGPCDGQGEDDRWEPPPYTWQEAMPDALYDRWINDLINSDPENQIADMSAVGPPFAPLVQM